MGAGATKKKEENTPRLLGAAAADVRKCA